MDNNDGRIYSEEELQRISDTIVDPDNVQPIEPTEEQLNRKPPRVLPNEPCPCESGKKFVDCCYTGPEKPCEKCGEVRFRTSYKTGGVRKKVACRNCGHEREVESAAE